MRPIHRDGEMAVWSEERWAAFESELQRELRRERQRLRRKSGATAARAPHVRRALAAAGALGCGLLALLLA